MDKSYKKPLLLITFGVILFAAFNNLNYVANFLKSCIGLLAPILSGLLLAFVLSVPVRGLAKRLRRKLTKATDRQIDMISLLLTLICVIAIIALLCVIAIPQLTASVKSIAALVQEKWPDWVGLLQRYGIDTEKLSAHFAALDWKSILQSISSEMNTVISSVANVAGSTVSAIADVAISLVITFYVLIGWRELSSQSKRALYAYCKESVADRICHISKLAHDTYAKFLSGQCVEVMILGTLIFLSFSVAGIPYAGLTAVLTAAFAFVPYIGGFLSCAFGILFTLLAAPNKALLAAHIGDRRTKSLHFIGSLFSRVADNRGNLIERSNERDILLIGIVDVDNLHRCHIGSEVHDRDINAVFGGENTHTVLDYTIGNRHDRFDQFARLRKGVVIDNVFNEREHTRAITGGYSANVFRDFHKDRAGGQPTVSIFTNIENTISSERFYEFLEFHCLYPPYFTVMRYCSDFF